MYSLNIRNDLIHIKDIKPYDLPEILEWYNKVDDFKFATGNDSIIDFRTLAMKFNEAVSSKNEFFSGIYLNKQNRLIGFIKGNLRNRNRDAVWISSIVIDTAFQNMGYGSSAIESFLIHIKTANNIKSAYLAVVEDNHAGKGFWLKNRFCELKSIKKRIQLREKHMNVIIMRRNI